ncbi:MAG TPA: HYR domain-containing protein, partial [candidate division Zixibacteria bacterium]|nr:HYR domain-containing protein [candidate division Zixibacteria bacterium]
DPLEGVHHDTCTGSVYVYSGWDGSLIYEKHGAAGDNLGHSVASAGDVNGDGEPDFIVGAVGLNHFGFSGFSGVFVYSGVDGSLLYQKNNVQFGNELGFSVASAGDMNGDGRSDVIVGAPLADSGGLANIGSAYVYVWDIIAPTISCPSDTAVSTFSGQCDRLITFSASASDNLPGVSVDCTPPSGSTYQKGISTVTCIATDAAANKDTCQFSVTVNDTETPVAVCPSDISTGAVPLQCAATVSYNAIATDNCVAVSMVCTPKSGSNFSVGTTPVTCIATDAASNADTCTFNVFVTVTKGDMNSDSSLSPADVVLMLNCVFLAAGNCGLCFADVDCDGQLSPADVVIELNAVFLNTPITCTP